MAVTSVWYVGSTSTDLPSMVKFIEKAHCLQSLPIGQSEARTDYVALLLAEKTCFTKVRTDTQTHRQTQPLTQPLVNLLFAGNNCAGFAKTAPEAEEVYRQDH